MKTPSQASWIHYLAIDDNTGKRFIKLNVKLDVSLSLYRKDEVDGCS